MMQNNIENLITDLHPLTQVGIYRSARAIILRKMDQKLIAPEKALEIIESVKSSLKEVKTVQEAKDFCLLAGQKFPELSGLATKLESQGDEEIDNLFSEIVDIFMQDNQMELAGKIMAEIESEKDTENRKKLLEELENNYPDQFAAAVAAVKNHKQ
jgi:hypothetical protein